MEKSTQAKIFEWISYLLIVGATVLFFVFSDEVPFKARQGTFITLLALFLALFCRSMMYRTRYKMFEEENEELKVDLRRLTNLLEIAKKEKEQKS